MKKFLALAFALILVLTTLTACGSSSDNTQQAGGTWNQAPQSGGFGGGDEAPPF